MWLGVLFFSLCGVAQNTETFTIPLSHPGENGKLKVHIVDGSITVNGYDGNEVIVTAIGDRRSKGWNKSKNQRTKNGLKKMVENSLEFTVEEYNNQVYVSYQPGKRVLDFEIQIPRNFSVDLRTVNQGNIMVEGVDGAHEVSNTNGKIDMREVGGSVIADALNQSITVTFEKVESDTTMMFSSLNGDVDISFPKSLKADITARSDNGNVYTDFEITKVRNSSNTLSSRNNGVYKVSNKKGVSGTINGGGASITFKTLNGDIMIREN